MDELNCNVILNNEENKITVSGLLDNELNIDISGDVDFADLAEDVMGNINNDDNGIS